MQDHLIIAIVNQGEGVHAVSAAKDAGATGGTLINAKGTGNNEMVMFLGITITPEKDMLLVVVDENIKEAVSAAIYKAAELNKKGNGIIFSFPVDVFHGLINQ